MQSPPARTMADYLLKDHQPAPSLVSDIRTHNSPFSLYGRRGRGMKGKSELECGKSLILCRVGMNQRAGKRYHDNRLGRGVDYYHPAGIPPGAGVSRRLRARADAAVVNALTRRLSTAVTCAGGCGAPAHRAKRIRIRAVVLCQA